MGWVKTMSDCLVISLSRTVTCRTRTCVCVCVDVPNLMYVICVNCNASRRCSSRLALGFPVLCCWNHAVSHYCRTRTVWAERTRTMSPLKYLSKNVIRRVECYDNVHACRPNVDFYARILHVEGTRCRRVCKLRTPHHEVRFFVKIV